MKKSAYIIGIISVCLIVVASIFKVSHFPGAGILLTLGLGSLSVVFLPVAFFNLLKSTNDKLLKLVYLTAFIAFFIDFVGALFKIMHWPGAGKLLIIGVPLPFILFLPTYIYYHNKRKLKTDSSFFAVLLFMIYLGVFSSLLALNYSKNILHSNATTANLISNSNNTLSSMFNPSHDCKQMIQLIDKIKLDLANYADQDETEINNYTTLHKKDMHMNIYYLAEKEINLFNQLFINYTNQQKTNDLQKRLINEINVHRVASDPNEYPFIAKLPMIATMNILSDWQNKILLIDYLRQEDRN